MKPSQGVCLLCRLAGRLATVCLDWWCGSLSTMQQDISLVDALAANTRVQQTNKQNKESKQNTEHLNWWTSRDEKKQYLYTRAVFTWVPSRITAHITPWAKDTFWWCQCCGQTNAIPWGSILHRWLMFAKWPFFFSKKGEPTSRIITKFRSSGARKRQHSNFPGFFFFATSIGHYTSRRCYDVEATSRTRCPGRYTSRRCLRWCHNVEATSRRGHSVAATSTVRATAEASSRERYTV